MPVIPALGKLRQEDCEFKVNLGYLVRPSPPPKRNNKYLLEGKNGVVQSIVMILTTI